jgi:hypothetical protein
LGKSVGVGCWEEKEARKAWWMGVCVFVIAITSVVQGRERESWGKGKGRGVGLIETN